MMMRTVMGAKPWAVTHSAPTCGRREKARKELNTVAPSTIKKIMPVETRFLEAGNQCLPVQSAVLPATRPVPAAPTAAAWVGVNQPR